MDAYEQLIPVGEQISYFIYFEVDPANIDVNIHLLNSVEFAFRNLRRAGMLKNRFFMEKLLPLEQDTASWLSTLEPAITSFVPSSSDSGRVFNSTCATAAIEAKASPRNFNIPARRKFLKANSTELSNILAEFERIALVHPEVAFSLYSNDSELFNLPVSPLRQRIMAIFGKKLNQQLLNIEVNTTMVKISGYVRLGACF